MWANYHVVLRNTGSGSRAYAFERFSLRGLPSGALYTPRFNPSYVATLLLDDTLSAGQTADGVISFVVSRSDTNFELYYQDSQRAPLRPIPVGKAY
jgi:hypothetical protein